MLFFNRRIETFLLILKASSIISKSTKYCSSCVDLELKFCILESNINKIRITETNL